MYNKITISYSNLTALPAQLSKSNLQELHCFHNDQLIKLPNPLPSSLIILHCHNNNQLTKLPNPLPSSLKLLYCYNNNQITVLPNVLPSSLITLYCYNNKLTTLPDILPSNLQTLKCYNNQLTALPANLPSTLQTLICNNNKLTALPANLPPTLEELYCIDNQLTVLPDLPTTLVFIGLNNNPELLIKYPLLEKCAVKSIFNVNKTIAYINEQNARLRAKARLDIINRNNIFLELYMKRCMHPKNLQRLLDDSEADVDQFMTAYVDSL